jgi:hypothetical protein
MRMRVALEFAGISASWRCAAARTAPGRRVDIIIDLSTSRGTSASRTIFRRTMSIATLPIEHLRPAHAFAGSLFSTRASVALRLEVPGCANKVAPQQMRRCKENDRVVVRNGRAGGARHRTVLYQFLNPASLAATGHVRLP